MAARNTAIPEDRRIELRIGINVGDIIIDEGEYLWRWRQHCGSRGVAGPAPARFALSDNAYQQIKEASFAFEVSDLR